MATDGEQVDPDRAVALSVERRLEALEEALALLRITIEQDLQTRRVTVVDGDGDARVIIEADRSTGSVVVRVSGDKGYTTGVSLYASEDGAGREASVGMAILRDGEVITRWTAG